MEGHWVQASEFDNMEGILDAVGKSPFQLKYEIEHRIFHRNSCAQNILKFQLHASDFLPFLVYSGN